MSNNFDDDISSSDAIDLIKEALDDIDLREKVKSVDITKIGVGNVCFLCGILTSIEEENDDVIVFVLNYNIKLTIGAKGPEAEVLKSRLFDPGVFVSKITRIDQDNEKFPVEATCKVAVYNPQTERTIM